MDTKPRSGIIYSHICAVAKNHTIGLNNKLPWHIPNDLQFFKEKTQKKVVIMGRKTFEALNRKPLPQRLNIVLSKNPRYSVPSTVRLCTGLDSAYQFCNTIDFSQREKEIFIIGGEAIYRQSLNQVTFIYLTRIHQEYKGDTFYPQLSPTQFQEISRKDFSGTPSYSFITYKNRHL